MQTVLFALTGRRLCGESLINTEGQTEFCPKVHIGSLGV